MSGLVTMSQLAANELQGKPFCVFMVRRMNGERIAVGYLDPAYEKLDSRGSDIISQVGAAVEKVQTYLEVPFDCIEYWIGNERIKRWE